jgi:hypothetical protein
MLRIADEEFVDAAVLKEAGVGICVFSKLMGH